MSVVFGGIDMHYSPILGPIVALAAWSLVMQVWLYASRFAAMKKAGISLKGRRGTRGNALEGLELSNFYDFHAWCMAEREQSLRDRAALLT